jgi:hypothetical protein
MTTATLPPDTAAADHAMLRRMLGDLANRQVEVQAAIRTWRNFTLSLCTVLVIALPLFALIAPHIGASLVTIRPVITGTGGQGTVAVSKPLSSGDLAAIELWGLLGGGVSIIAALGQLRVSSRPSSLQITQLILKPLAGAAVALFGIVLTQGGLFAQLQPVSSGAIAAYALLFGFAQQALTRMVDKKASTLAGNADSAGTKAATA